MKERSIILKPWEVRAVLAGDKTQLRRVIKNIGNAHGVGEIYKGSDDSKEWIKECPYGLVGDRLWVKETTQEDFLVSHNSAKYGADMKPVESVKYWWYRHSTCPSIHMPRKACRILLEITDVRVERLHDIDHKNISDNGISDFGNEDYGYPFLNPATGSYYDNADSAYIDLWESDHGAGSWDINPWVWVIDFLRTT